MHCLYGGLLIHPLFPTFRRLNSPVTFTSPPSVVSAGPFKGRRSARVSVRDTRWRQGGHDFRVLEQVLFDGRGPVGQEGLLQEGLVRQPALRGAAYRMQG